MALERFINLPHFGHFSGSMAQVRRNKAAQRVILDGRLGSGISLVSFFGGLGLSLPRALAK